MMGESGTDTSRPEGAADIDVEARLKLSSAEPSDLDQVSRDLDESTKTYVPGRACSMAMRSSHPERSLESFGMSANGWLTEITLGGLLLRGPTRFHEY